MGELCFTVLLERDRDDPGVYRVTIPGLPGFITSLGSRRQALDTARAALEELVHRAGPEERSALLLEQLGGSPADYPPGARPERICIPASQPVEPALARQ